MKLRHHLIALLFLGAPLQAATWTHTSAGSFNWNTAGYWSGGVPNGTGAVAEFKSPGTWGGASTITQSSNLTLGTLRAEFSAPNRGNLTVGTTSAADVTFAVSGGSALIETTGANNLTIQGRNININSSLNITTESFVRLTTFNIDGGRFLNGSGNITKSGTGQLDFNIVNTTWSGNLTVLGGTVSAGTGMANSTGQIFLHNSNGAEIFSGNWGTRQLNFVDSGSDNYKITAGVYNGSLVGASLQESIEFNGTTLGGNNSGLSFAGSSQRIIANGLTIRSAHALGANNTLPLRLNGNLGVGQWNDPITLTVNGPIEISGSASLTNRIEVYAETGPRSELAGDIILNYNNIEDPAMTGILGYGLEISGEISNGGTAPAGVRFTGNVLLTGASTYDGDTLAVGTLVVNNTEGSATGTGNVSISGVNNYLRGEGSIAGNVSVGGGARVLPGAGEDAGSIGTLTLQKDLNLANNARIVLELGGSDPGDYDRIVGMQNITIAGTMELLLVNSFVPVLGDTFSLLAWSGLADFSGFDEELEFLLPTLDEGLSWDISDFQTSGTASVVPEPSTVLLLMLGAAAVLFSRRGAEARRKN